MIVTFKDIKKNKAIDIVNFLNNHYQYYAHTNETEKELLAEHIELTVAYFIKLIEVNKLEPIIDLLIKKISIIQKKEIYDYIKSLILNSIIFHDIGKINENFQIDKMENKIFSQVNNCIGSKHSLLSAYLFIASTFNNLRKINLTKEESELLFVITIFLSYPIFEHHGKLLDINRLKFESSISDALSGYFNFIISLQDIDKKHFSNLISSEIVIKDILTNYLKNLQDPFSLYAFIKLMYSLLTASDYYATNEFMLKIKNEDFGIINTDLKNKINNSIYSIPYNDELIKNIDYYRTIDFENVMSISKDNLNILRQKLSLEVISNINNNIDKRLFYIEAPTGSGKTNISILCLAELLKNRDDITKIFYVFPFTTLINQTASFLKESLNLEHGEFAEIHSKASCNNINDENNYGEKKQNYIDNLFVNYPISLISHIKFFDILISCDKSANYLLHRVANSVVIIDELQSYPPNYWDKINYIINTYSKLFNITFILMSATLPKISKLLHPDNKEHDDFVYLVSDKNKYFMNPNFKNRVIFNFDYLTLQEFSLDDLLALIYNKSENYYNKHKTLKAIVEFVTKKTAHQFYAKIKEDARFNNYKLFIISGTILNSRRQEIIKFLKSTINNEDKIVVVCTQVIEAGLDIDMDIGFKDKSIFDAEEQLAGRINRNATKSDCELFIFNLLDSNKTYRKDLRHKQKPDIELYKQILVNKKFDIFYEKVFQDINSANCDEYRAENLPDFFKQIKKLNFKDVGNQFELIKDNSISVFVPLSIGVEYFSQGELTFLKQTKIIDDIDKEIKGSNVYALYTSIIENKKLDFIDKRIDLKILASILSKFTFSIWNNKNQINSLKIYSDGNNTKYGFLYLNNYEEIYSYNEGLRHDVETDCILF